MKWKKPLIFAFCICQLLISEAQQNNVRASSIFMDSLKMSSRYRIDVESKGCFHHLFYRVQIDSTVKGCYAWLAMKGIELGEGLSKINTKYKRVKLSVFQIKALQRFEGKLLNYSQVEKDVDCAKTKFSMRFGRNKIDLHPDDCQWNGVNELIKIIYPNF